MTTDTTTEPQPTLHSLLTRLWRHLSKRRQRQLGLLLVLMVASAFSEVISLGAVLPFIGILTPPEKVFNNVFVKSVCESFGITAANELVLPLTVIFVCAAILAGATTMQKSKIKLDFEHDTIILDPRVAKLKLV